jgi:hypothetical protein
MPSGYPAASGPGSEPEKRTGPLSRGASVAYPYQHKQRWRK